MNLHDIDAAIAAVRDRRAGDPVTYAEFDVLLRAAEAMRRQLFGSYEGDDPMPVFVIKAKDRFAVAAIEAYRAACDMDGLTEHAGEVLKAIDEIERWQFRNPDRVQTPNHPHVAAA